MTPDQRFLKQPKSFWANVRSISQHFGYAEKVKKAGPQQGKGGPPSKKVPKGEKQPSRIAVPSIQDMVESLKAIGLESTHIVDGDGKPTTTGQTLVDYYQHRADLLNDYVLPRLMDKNKAKKVYDTWYKKLKPKRPVPMNKQKGEKKAPAFLTGLVNMIVEAHSGGLTCDYDPRELTTITLNGVPLRTLARRVDGAFPGPVNPIAIWEIKEYYYTTTFGSRVADGVYESLLDGMELEELRENEKIDVKHYLMVDDRFTWWDCGKSYLCRIIDMLHMGYVDEALFGYEVVERLPTIVKEWVKTARQQTGPDSWRPT